MEKYATLTLLLAGLPLAAALAQSAAPAAAKTKTAAANDSVPRYWNTHVKGGLSANEGLVSSNWKSGGSSALGVSLMFNGMAHYERYHHNWNAETDLLYAGQYTADGTGYRKTTDRLWFDGKYGRDLSPHWGLYTALNLLSQFAPGYQYADDGTARLISSFLAPGYLTSSTGAEYQPNEHFTLRLSPLAPRVTLVRQPNRLRYPADTTIYGVSPGHAAYWQFGFQALTELDQPLGDHANLKLRYLFFVDYAHLTLRESTHRVDFTLSANINDWLNTSLTAIVLYDYNQDKGFQYNQNLSLGLHFERRRAANRPGAR